MLPPCHVMSFYTQNSCIAKQKNPQIQSTFLLFVLVLLMHALSLSLSGVFHIIIIVLYFEEREKGRKNT